MLEQLRRKEIGFGEFIGLSFKLYWKNLPWIALFTLLLSVSLQFLMSLSIFQMVQSYPYGYVNGDLSYSLWMIPFIFVSMIFGFLLMMSITLIIWKSIKGEKLEVKEIFQIVCNKVFSSIKISILVGAIVLVCCTVPMVLFFIAGFEFIGILFIGVLLYLAGIYFFTQQALVIEDQRGRAALRYSRELVKGKWWKVFGFTFGAGIIAWLCSMVILAIFRIFAFIPGWIFIQSGVESILSSFTWVSTAVLFINLNFVQRKASYPVPMPNEITENTDIIDIIDTTVHI